MTWNFRVFRRAYLERKNVEVSYGVYECHYDENDKPMGWSRNEVQVVGETLKGLEWMLEKMTEALKKPVLDYETGAEVQQYLVNAENYAHDGD